MSIKSELLAVAELLAGRPLMTRQDLSARYAKVDLHTIDRWHRNGTLPKAIYLPGCRIPLWRPLEIIRNELRKPKLLRKRARKN